MTYNIVLNPEYEFLRGCVETLIKSGRPADAVDIYRGRNLLYKCRLDNIQVVVKQFKRPNALNAYVYTTVRRSKAARSFENAMKMEELGFLTPRPIAYAEARNGLKLERSIYVSGELTGATEMRHWEELPFSDSLVRDFAKEIYRLHKAGVFHRDFSPGNVLFTGNEREGFKFHYVDLNRMKFGVSDHHRQMRMFRAINLNPSALGHLARAYAEVSGQAPDRIELEAQKELDGYFAEQRRKKFLKSLLLRTK